MRDLDLAAFFGELSAVEKRARNATSREDFKHLLRFQRRGRVCTAIGLITGCLVANPLSAYLLGLGNFNRWMVAHHILHGAYDHVPGVPDRYKSPNYARGLRRFFNWADWIHPEAWTYEHNVLHHFNTGEKSDPDQVERLFRTIRKTQVPLAVKFVLFIGLTLTWKWSYYAPSTLMHLAKSQGKDNFKDFRFQRYFNPTSALGRKFWSACILPVFTCRFLLLPLIAFQFSRYIALQLFLTLVLGELFANFHSFLTIAPNHSGADLYRYHRHPKNREESALFNIVGTVNYLGNTEFRDFFHGNLNYHIEHHLWPDLTMHQCRLIAPEIERICGKYQIPYKKDSIAKRFRDLSRICLGLSSMPLLHRAPGFQEERRRTSRSEQTEIRSAS